MTDLTDQQNEALEHAESSAHAAESGDPLTLRVTLSIAVMAVVAAFIGALGETEASHTFVEKSDAVLAQAKEKLAGTSSAGELNDVKDRLQTASHKLAEAMYKAGSAPTDGAAAAAGTADQPEEHAKHDEGVIDAEYVDVDKK